MALQSSGTITIQDIADEFGGTAPHSLSEYYRNGAYVGSSNTGVPTSGTISLSDFYGASAATVVTVTEDNQVGAYSISYGYCNYYKLYEPESGSYLNNQIFGSRTPTTLNGAGIDGIYYSDDKNGTKNYFVVILRGNRAQGFFTSVTPQGGTTLNTSSATRFTATRNGTLSTYWYWSASPSGWNGSGTRTATFA